MNALPFNRWVMEKVMGIDRRRPLPALAAQTFTDWFARRPAPAAAPRGEVVLFHDTFVTYNTPEIGRAAVELLEAAGYRVVLVDRKCCGRPLISKGMLDRGARARGVERRRACTRTRRAAWPSWGSSPRACSRCATSTVDLLRTDEARTVARQSALLEQFLLRERERGPRRCRSGGHGARRCSTATATRRRSSARRPR